jgi:hypothetical protein
MHLVYRYISILEKKLFLAKLRDNWNTHFVLQGTYCDLIKQIKFYVSYLITREPWDSFWYIFIRFSYVQEIENLKEKHW